ncbi:MAG: guanylate kinase [Lachnospiraceae bacterium]|nr:guanylate kinase [Lachnospiraceae bacterium]
MSKRKGVLTVISGYSGSGKGTVMKALMAKYGEVYKLSVSATTRKPREGEEHGREYFFVNREEFERMIAEEELLEHACYVENYYGTPKAAVVECLEKGIDVLLEIEMQGGTQIKEKFPEAVLLFIMPPSAAELKRRLIGRGTETPEVIEARLKRAKEEAHWMDEYDYLLINENVDECVEQLHNIIQCQHFRPAQCGSLISQIKEELNQL